MARRAKGAYTRMKSKGGPGMTRREDPPENWKPSLAPVPETAAVEGREHLEWTEVWCNGRKGWEMRPRRGPDGAPHRHVVEVPLARKTEVEAGGRGGARFVNPRAGDVERRYGADDDRFRAGVYVRSLMERASGGAQSTIVRVLEAAEVGDAALEKRISRGVLTNAQADALDDLRKVCQLVGKRAFSVLRQWFMDGLTLTEIDAQRGWRGRSASVYADGALQDVADWRASQHKTCQLRSEALESPQAGKTANR